MRLKIPTRLWQRCPANRRLQVLLAVIAGAHLLLSGCASLEPVDLPGEYALPPAETQPWRALAAENAADWFALLNTGQQGLAWRLRAIDSATRSIDLQTFLWKEDPSGFEIMRHILMAAKRGVRIRFLIDDTFTIDEDHLLYQIDQHPNIAVRIYNPFNRRYNSFVLRELMNLGAFARLDHRMHNKTMVVDNRAAIIGGRNLADAYFGYHPQSNFRDMEVLTVGPVAVSISEQFDAYWNCGWSFPVDRIIKTSAGAPKPEEQGQLLAADPGRQQIEDVEARQVAWSALARAAQAGNAILIADEPAHVNPSLSADRPNQLARLLIDWIDRAREEIIIVSAYLIPTPELEAAVERAENRGVHVRILTNSLRSNNHTAAHAVYRRHIKRIMDHGADLHEVRARAKDRAFYMQAPVDDKDLGLHAKLLLIDQTISFIGSPNLDPRSLRLNTEIGILVQSQAFNHRVRQKLEMDFSKRNAWHLQQSDSGNTIWVADDAVRTTQPAASSFQLLEDWFLSILPIEDEM